MIEARAWFAPTRPVKIVLDVPAVVKAYGVVETLSTDPLKVTVALLVVKVAPAPKVTLLPKVCTPEVVIAPPLMAVVPVKAF